MNAMPGIVLARTDYAKLMKLGSVAEDLIYEIERAQVVDDAAVPDDAVRMGSRVRYRTDAGDEREVTVVYPAEADISQGRVSVMTPIGTALIGMRVGCAIEWTARNGKVNEMTVIAVDN